MRACQKTLEKGFKVDQMVKTFILPILFFFLFKALYESFIAIGSTKQCYISILLLNKERLKKKWILATFWKFLISYNFSDFKAERWWGTNFLNHFFFCFITGLGAYLNNCAK